MTVLLENKNAVVYGAGGAIGAAVAGAFAREGARVFLAGRTRASLDRVAGEISAAGGMAEVDEVDALDERQVEDHAAAITRKVGGLDISFNAISHADVHGSNLLDMALEDFARPITIAVRSQFLTSRAAARHMATRRRGVIMTITAATARQAIPEVGGTGVAFDALESLCRQWACELGPLGIRVVWLHTTGIPEAFPAAGGTSPAYGTGHPMTRDEHVAWMRDKTMLRRLTSLADVGNMAALIASDRAATMTAAAMNITCGAVPTR
jgi:3-oxoacyl-[acyl-carrier protein] reductase